MNYQKIYNDLVHKRQKEQLLVKCGNCEIETHHIVPHAYGGSNDTANLVNLTLREHFVAHLLLLKIAQDEGNVFHIIQMNNAILKMLGKVTCPKSSRMYLKLVLNSRQFAKHCIDNGIQYAIFNYWTGKHLTQSMRDKIRKTMTPVNSKNPRVWVNKNGEVKYLRKVFLDDYLKDGWHLGRDGYKPKRKYKKRK